MADFVLPEIGEGVSEGELIQWLVKEGDSVESDQPFLEIMTDKATVEVPAPFSGTVKTLKFKEGDMLPVGGVIAEIEKGSDKEASNGSAKTSTKKDPEKTPTETKKEAIPKTEATTPAQTTPPQSASASASVATYSQDPTTGLSSDSVPAAPIVRRMARDAGVSLSQVPASGAPVGGQNRVLEEDLLRYINEKQSAGTTATPTPVSSPTKSIPSTQYSGTEDVERKPLRGLRRAISQAMVRSKFTAPHYAYVDEFECSELYDLRQQAKPIAEEYGVKFSYLPFIVKALVGALKDFPIVNSSLEEEDGKMEIVLKKFYHIGIAVATDDGLIVPVIKNADQKSLIEIASEINSLSEKTRQGKASPDELRGSTFTITSMGNLGGLFATPIINYPEVGIMGVYKIQDKPLVEKGQIVIGKTMTLSLSLDHRVVDGAIGAHFCNAVISRLKNPAKLMMELK